MAVTGYFIYWRTETGRVTQVAKIHDAKSEIYARLIDCDTISRRCTTRSIGCRTSRASRRLPIASVRTRETGRNHRPAGGDVRRQFLLRKTRPRRRVADRQSAAARKYVGALHGLRETSRRFQTRRTNGHLYRSALLGRHRRPTVQHRSFEEQHEGFAQDVQHVACRSSLLSGRQRFSKLRTGEFSPADNDGAASLGFKS